MHRLVSLFTIGVIVIYNVWFASFEVEAAYSEHIMNEIKNTDIQVEGDILEELLQEEQRAKIDKAFEELVIELPSEKIEWDIDHEKGIGVEDEVVTTFSTRSSIFYYDYYTSTSAVGDMTSVNKLKFGTSRGNYVFGEQVKSSFNMPGMSKTAVLTSSCDEMIPQGILSYGGYIFITAYCGGKEHNSVIYVLDAATKQFLVTLVTGGDSHAGGIEYADGYLWLCETGSNNTGRIECYNYTNVMTAIRYGLSYGNVQSISIANYCNKIITLKNNDKASFISRYNGYLVIGEYNKSIDLDELFEFTDATCELNFYIADDLLNGNNEPEYTIKVPSYAQGITFYSSNNVSYVLITTSPGTQKKSVVYVYKSSGSVINSTLTLSLNRKIEMPCLVEESIVYGNYTYFVYESCGKKYREGTSENKAAIHVVGKVCGFDNSFIYK